MQYRTALLATSLVSIMAITQSAFAEERPGTFEALDADHNGYISAEEAKARTDLTDQWSSADANKDGKLNSAEFSAFEGRGQYTPPEESEIHEPGAAPYSGSPRY